MKRLQRNITLGVVIISSTSLFCMDKGNDSIKKLKDIDAKNKEKLTKHISSQNPAREIIVLEKKLKKQEQDLITRQNDIVAGIKQQCLTEMSWQYRKELTKKAIDCRKNSDVFFPTILRDKNIPADFADMLTNNLKEYGINPEWYHFTTGEKTGLFMETVLYDNPEGKITACIKTPGIIAINPKKIASLSLQAKQGLCRMIALGIKPYENVLLDFFLIQDLNKLNCYDFWQFKICERYISFIRQFSVMISVIIDAVRNKDMAAILKQYQGESGGMSFSGELSMEQYTLLAKINRYHQALDWLKRCALESTEKAIDIKTQLTLGKK